MIGVKWVPHFSSKSLSVRGKEAFKGKMLLID